MNKKSMILRDMIFKLKEKGQRRRDIIYSLGLTAAQYAYLSASDEEVQARKEKSKKYRSKLLVSPLAKLRLNVARFQSKSECNHPFTAEDVIAKFGENPKCYLTGLPVDYENPSTYQLDHVNPVALGGNSELDNLKLCHPVVNSMKRDLTIEQFVGFCKLICENFKE